MSETTAIERTAINGYLLERRWGGDKGVWQFPPNSTMDLGAEQNLCPCGARINAAQVVQRCYECLNEAYGFQRVPQRELPDALEPVQHDLFGGAA